MVSFDYAFVSDHGKITIREGFEAAGEGAAKIAVVRDSKSKSLFAHVVPTNGVDEKGFAVDALMDDVQWMAYTKVTLKSVDEPAVVKLRSEALSVCWKSPSLVTCMTLLGACLTSLTGVPG